jgi:tetratricopeptide (TPR) repeat protein
MDILAWVLNSPLVLYGLLAVGAFFVYQRVAPMIRVRVPGGPVSKNDLLARVLGARYVEAQLEGRVKAFKKKGNLLEAGRLYEEAGKLQQAIDTFTEGQEFYAAATVLERQGKVERAAEVYLQAGDYKKAAQLFTDAGKPARAAELFLGKGNTLEAARLYGLGQA